MAREGRDHIYHVAGEQDQNLAEHVRKMYDFCGQIQEKQLNVSDIGIPYQWVNNWDKEALLFHADREDGKWRKFNFVDYLWIRIILELRDFGASYDTIRTVKEYLEEPVMLDPLHDHEEDAGGNGTSPEGGLPPVDALSLLTLLIVEIIATKAHIQLLVHSDGASFLLNHHHDHLYGEDLEAFRKNSYLTISLNELLINFIGQHELDFLLPYAPLIRREETEVLKHLRSGDLTRLLIRETDGTERELVSEYGEDSTELELDFLQAIVNHPYQFIEFETGDEKIVKFKYKKISSQH